MKKYIIITILLHTYFSVFSQRDYTFCYSTISLTLFDGGKAAMIRYNNSGSIENKVYGSYILYGKGNSTELLKITFNNEEYTYDLIRDGMGIPSVIFDRAQNRKYTNCKISNISNQNTESSSPFGFGGEKTVRLGNTIVLDELEYQQNDLSTFDLTWQDAKYAATLLGPDWRLPTLKEIEKIYKHKPNNPNIRSSEYWTSDEIKINVKKPWGDELFDGVYIMNFQTGQTLPQTLTSTSSLSDIRQIKQKAFAVRKTSFVNENKPNKTSFRGKKYESIEKYLDDDEQLFLVSIWMNSNLNVDVFRNGDKIPHAITNEDWINAGLNKQPAWCYYNNDSSLGEIYGKIYNYYAITDTRGLAPKGFKIPTSDDWNELITNSKTNRSDAQRLVYSSEFKAIPSGFRSANGQFNSINQISSWWQLEKYQRDDAVVLNMNFGEKFRIQNETSSKSDGRSVRCLRIVIYED